MDEQSDDLGTLEVWSIFCVGQVNACSSKASGASAIRWYNRNTMSRAMRAGGRRWDGGGVWGVVGKGIREIVAFFGWRDFWSSKLAVARAPPTNDKQIQ